MFAQHRSTSDSNTKIQGISYFSNYLSVQISSSMWIYTEGAPSSSSRLLQHHSCSEQQGKRRLPTAGWIWWPQVTKIISERLMFLFKQGPASCCCWSCQICSVPRQFMPVLLSWHVWHPPDVPYRSVSQCHQVSRDIVGLSWIMFTEFVSTVVVVV